jgi:glycerol uptake facilitator protein/aquaporin Z
VFPVEAASMAAIIVIVALFLGSPKLASKVPFTVGTCIGLVIFSLGPVTGGVVNPARQFGPAVISGQTQLLWVFLLAPLVGGFLAPVIHRFLPGPKPTTHALCGPAAQSS